VWGEERHIACVGRGEAYSVCGERRGVCRVLVGKCEGKKSFVKPRR
jgi:hypothetical protein